MDTLRSHITTGKFCEVSGNQVEPKIRAGNLVHSANWSLWQHAGKREGSVRGSSEGGTHCPASQIFEGVSTYSECRKTSIAKQGRTELTTWHRACESSSCALELLQLSPHLARVLARGDGGVSRQMGREWQPTFHTAQISTTNSIFDFSILLSCQIWANSLALLLTKVDQTPLQQILQVPCWRGAQLLPWKMVPSAGSGEGLQWTVVFLKKQPFPLCNHNPKFNLDINST